MTQPVKGYKYRLCPTKSQIDYFNQLFGCTRFVWNRYLAESSNAYTAYKTELAAYAALPINLRCTTDVPVKPPLPNYNAFSASLTQLKKLPEYEWLNEPPATCLHRSLSHLGDAYMDFFKPSRKGAKKAKLYRGYPKFKKRHSRQSATFSQDAFSFESVQLRLVKLSEPVKIRWSRPLPSVPKTAVVSRTPSGEYYVSFTCECQPTPTAGTAIIGVDLGITDLATCSDGQVIPNPKHYHRSQRKLARIQRKLCRQKKGSNSRAKTRVKLAKLHQHIANQRQDCLHKLSRQIIDKSHVVCLEDLQVANMAKNRHLSKAIMTAGWNSFREMLTYKSRDSQHTNVCVADAFFPSSQLCSVCNERPAEKLKLSQRVWQCPHCHTVNQRDLNAALNLRQHAINNRVFWQDKAGCVINLIDYNPLPKADKISCLV